MKKVLFYLLLFSLPAVSLLFSPSAAAAAETCNRIVAVVNSDVVTLYELNAKIRQMTGSSPEELKRLDRERYLETRREVLNHLIEEKLTQEKIEELGINVSSEAVDATIEKIKEHNRMTHEELLKQLEEQGISYEAYRQDIRDRLERVRLINQEVKSKIIIRKEKLKEYYRANKDEFRKTGKVRLATIFLERGMPGGHAQDGPAYRKAEEILRRLESGESFSALARRFSQGPGADEGGDLGYFETSDLDPQLQEILQDMSEGAVTEPIVTETTVQIVKLLERQESGVQPFRKVKDAIHDKFYREEINRRYSSWIDELKKKAYTKIIF